MSEIFSGGLGFIVAVLFLVPVFIGITKSRTKNQYPYTIITCPNCGAKAKKYNDHWECEWCGDCGDLIIDKEQKYPGLKEGVINDK